MKDSIVHRVMLEVTASPGWSLHVRGDNIESFRVVPVEERERKPPEETLAIPSQKDFYDRIIEDASNERRRMPWLFGKPAIELSKKELLVLAIILTGPMDSYVSKEVR